MVTDLAVPERRTSEMGWYSVAWGLGYLIGPFTGGLVIQRFGYSPLFALSASFIVLALVIDIVWIVPKHTKRVSTPQHFAVNISTTRKLLPWYMMLLFCTMVIGVIGGILPGYANSVGVGPEIIGVLFTVYGISRVLCSAMSERYSDFKEKTALGFTSLIIAFGTLLIALFPNFYGFLGAVVMVGGAFGAIFPISISVISRHFPSDRMGAAMGSYETTLGIGFAIGPLLAGVVASLTNLTTTFTVTAIFGIFALVSVTSGSTHFQGTTRQEPQTSGDVNNQDDILNKGRLNVLEGRISGSLFTSKDLP
jgi:predicted MFS family arabinose efflux permease